jgi:hypothetical protein
MNRDSIQEYISWLERFEVIYKDYIDSSEELKEIFTGTLEKFKKVLRGNNRNLTEEDIIKLLKELVKEFSVAYDKNGKINKTLEGPRNTDAFKQAIYNNEIAELKKWLISNINNKKLFPNFERIVMFVAKNRQMIEFLKLGKVIDAHSIEHSKYFEVFGKRRKPGDFFSSPLFYSHAEHLHKAETEKFKQIIYTYKGRLFEDLTGYMHFFRGSPMWFHTDAQFHSELFKIMNELYSEFLSLVNRQNSVNKKDILVELYWLYMQTCPFERGSAAIGEILFSVLLRKYFSCDFFISRGWHGNPKIIPDIHALHYQLDHFKSIFWKQFTNCAGNSNQNINNATTNQLRREVIGP